MPEDPNDIANDFEIIEHELKQYGRGLLNKERIVVLNKMELVDENYLKIITQKLENISPKIILYKCIH